jgi:hypothetical protein
VKNVYKLQNFSYSPPPCPFVTIRPYSPEYVFTYFVLYFAPAIVDTSWERNNDETQMMGWLKTGTSHFTYFPLILRIFLWIMCLVNYKHKLVSSNQWNICRCITSRVWKVVTNNVSVTAMWGKKKQILLIFISCAYFEILLAKLRNALITNPVSGLRCQYIEFQIRRGLAYCSAAFCY